MNYLKVLFDLYIAKRNVKKSAAQIEKLQKKRLLKMLKYAYEHSAYYRRMFNVSGITAKNIGTVALDKFPTINKKTLLSHFDEIVTVSDITQNELRRFDEGAEKDRRAFKGKYHVVHSSGSTGKPGYFVYDNKAWSGMLIGVIRAALWGMSMPQILKFLADKPRIAYTNSPSKCRQKISLNSIQHPTVCLYIDHELVLYRRDGRTLRRRNGGRRRHRRRGRFADIS